MTAYYIDEIQIPQKRLRAINPEKVQEIARSITQIGLINPIAVARVGKQPTLVAGLHRLEAYKSLGIETIDCILVEEAQAELIEIDENLIRQELTILEQAEHIARRDEILEELGMRAKPSPGTNQYTPTPHDPLPILEALEDEMVGVTVTPTKTTEDLAQEIGLSKNSFQKRKQIAKNIEPEVKEILRETPIANSTTQLLEVARMEPEEQEELAEAVKTGEVSSVKEFKANRFTSMEKSAKTDEHYTPEKITNFLYQFRSELDLDPCSNPGKNIRAKKHYTKEDNGLVLPWNGSVFVNPPFSEVGAWAEKAIAEYQEGSIKEVVFLSKFDARVGWFKSLINGFSCFCLVEGYVSYHGNDGDSATFTTALWYLGEDKSKFSTIFSGLGWVCEVTHDYLPI